MNISRLRQGVTPSLKRQKKRHGPLSPSHLKQCAELRSAWDAVSQVSGGRINASGLSKSLGVHKSVAGQYLSGAIPLNVEWQLNFSQYLGLSPQEIWSDWPYSRLTISPNLRLLMVDWDKLESASRVKVMNEFKSWMNAVAIIREGHEMP